MRPITAKKRIELGTVTARRKEAVLPWGSAGRDREEEEEGRGRKGRGGKGHYNYSGT